MLSDDEIKKNLGKVLKELRSKKGLTQEKLAEYTEVQAQTIRAIEKGRSFVSSDSLAKFSNFFEVDPSIFFSKNISIMSEDKQGYISQIKRILPLFTPTKLKEIYDILLVMHK